MSRPAIDQPADAGAGLIASAQAMAVAAWRGAPAHLTGYLLTMVVEALTPVAAAWVTKLIIDRLAAALAGEGAGELAWLAGALAALGVVAVVAAHTGTYVSAEVSRRLSVTLTDELFTAAARLPGIRPFEDPRFLDRLRMAREGTTTAGGTITGAFATGRSALLVAGFVGTLLAISPLLTAVLLASAVPAGVAHLHLSRHRAGMLWQLSPVERWQYVYSGLLGSAEAAKEIRLFGSGRFLRDRMMTHLRTATAARRRMDRRELVTEGLLALLGAAVAGAGLMWAVNAALAGTLTPGDVTLFAGAVAAIQGTLAGLVTAAAGVHHGLLLFRHHLMVVTAPPDLPVRRAGTTLPPLRRGIELRDVWFRYSPEHPWTLRGVNLFLPAGQAVALVGANGAGKSTLVKLLCRFYDPDRGEILWDGVDLRDVPPDELRRRISAVFQDHVAYDLSAAENVAIGDISVAPDPERIRAAAHRAGIDNVLRELPQGYETLLTRMFFGDGDTTGVELSGGQWQRVALARAYFRDHRDFMILDEPSAGLDPQAEADLHDQMRRYRAGRTSLLISHRLNTVRDADLVVVLDEGAVVERGTHQSLMRTEGVYARLFRLQSAGYQSVQPPQVR